MATGLVAWTDARSGHHVAVGAGEIVEDDLYLFGETVTVAGTVRGDVVAFARQVTVSGTIEGDLAAAAQAVVVEGAVLDDARIAGQVLRLGSEAAIGDDLVAAGFSLEAVERSRIGGGLLFAGYQALLAGTVAGDVRGAMAALRLAGRIDGGVDVAVGRRGEAGPPFVWPAPVAMPSVEPGLAVSDTAAVGGDLRYRSESEGEIGEAARVGGEVAFVEEAEEEAPENRALALVLGSVRRLAGILIVGGAMLLLPGWVATVTSRLRQRPAASGGWGIVVFLGVLVAALAVAVVAVIVAMIFGLLTLGGLSFGAVALGGLAVGALVVGSALFWMYVAPALVAIFAGRFVVRGEPRGGKGLLALLLGSVALVILAAIPIFGFLVRLAVVVFALGALALWLRSPSSEAAPPRPRTGF